MRFRGRRSWLGLLLGNVLLLFFPVPIGPMRGRLAGRVNAQGDLEFYSHPNFVCCCHLVWIGWLAAAVGMYNDWSSDHDAWRIPVEEFLNVLWLATLVLTLLVSGLKFDRIACGFLLAGLTIFGLLLVLVESLTRLSLISAGWSCFQAIPWRLRWGAPCIVSFALGSVFATVAAWQVLNDRWILPAVGNYIEHCNFQQRDRSIARGAKSFIACYDCLLRRYLLFGYGDIEVRTATGQAIVDRIEGVFFAAWHAERIKRRLATTDVSVTEASEEEDEDDISA